MRLVSNGARSVLVFAATRSSMPAPCADDAVSEGRPTMIVATIATLVSDSVMAPRTLLIPVSTLLPVTRHRCRERIAVGRPLDRGRTNVLECVVAIRDQR